MQSDKEKKLEEPFEKVRERDKTIGSEVAQKLYVLENRKMYESHSALREVSIDVALELLWHWINEIRFDGVHSQDVMLMARGALQVPGEHQWDCLSMTELAGSGVDVMAGSIRYQLSQMYSFLLDNFKEVCK